MAGLALLREGYDFNGTVFWSKLQTVIDKLCGFGKFFFSISQMQKLCAAIRL